MGHQKRGWDRSGGNAKNAVFDSGEMVKKGVLFFRLPKIAWYTSQRKLKLHCSIQIDLALPSA